MRLSNSDISRYVMWDMDPARTTQTWWNRAAGFAIVKDAPSQKVTVRDQSGSTGECWQNTYGIAKINHHRGAYPATILNEIGNTSPGDLCMGVGVTRQANDGWGNTCCGHDAPGSETDWPNARIDVPPHVSVWLK